MKKVIFDDVSTVLNPIAIADFEMYLKAGNRREGTAPTRHYMQHRGQDGYTRIRQTKTRIIVEWMK